jgi:hypothetical protein
VLCVTEFFDPMVRQLLILVFSLAAAATVATGQSLPQAVNLSSMVGGGSNAVMVIDARGVIDAAWLGTGVFFGQSVDGGATFSTKTVLALSSPPAGVQMSLDAMGNINLLWTTPPDDLHVGGSAFLSRSTDGGVTFSTPGQFSPSTGVTSAFLEMKAAPDGTINITWLDQNKANLLYARSTDGGKNFSAPATVWKVAGDLADLHTVVGPGGEFYIFWTGIASSTRCDVLFSRTLDRGATFSTVANLSNAQGICNASPRPNLDPNGGVDVAWLANNSSVLFSRSGDQGATFSAPTSVSGSVQFFLVGDQQVAADSNGGVDIVWSGTLAASTVFFAHSEDEGATFATPQILSLPPVPNNTGAGNPMVSEGPCGSLVVAWSDDSVGTFSGDFDVFLERSNNDWEPFTNPLNVSNTSASAEVVSQLVVDLRGNANLLWSTVNFPFNVFFDRVAPAFSRAGDFATSVLPGQATAPQGATEQFQVAVHALQNPGETVTFSCNDLPASAACSFNPASITTQTTDSNSVMTLTVPATLFPGTYLFAVNAVSATTTDTQTVELVVQAPGSGSSTSALDGKTDPTSEAREPTREAAGLAEFERMPEFVCSSSNARLCGALDPNRPRPQWPIRRRCSIPQ